MMAVGCVSAAVAGDKAPIRVHVVQWFTRGSTATMNVSIVDYGTWDNERRWAIRCENCGALEVGNYDGTLDQDKVELGARDMKGKAYRQKLRVISHQWIKPLPR
jgi:hypothetical protein